jgi:hypothetical protein
MSSRRLIPKRHSKSAIADFDINRTRRGLGKGRPLACLRDGLIRCLGPLISDHLIG